MKDIYTYLSPFLAALIASVITYFFTTRAKKQEVLILQRLQAFKAVQKQLALFKAYYFAKLSEIQGNEFAPMVKDLPDDARKPPLLQRQSLESVLSDNAIFLSSASRKSLSELDSSLGLLCNLELDHEYEVMNLVNRVESKYVYEQLLFQIELCIDRMYKDLKLPT
jgi:hypothetical protein